MIAEDNAGTFLVASFLVDQIDSLALMQDQGQTGLVIPDGYTSPEGNFDPKIFQLRPVDLLNLVGLAFTLPDQFEDL